MENKEKDCEFCRSDFEESFLFRFYLSLSPIALCSEYNRYLQNVTKLSESECSALHQAIAMRFVHMIGLDLSTE